MIKQINYIGIPINTYFEINLIHQPNNINFGMFNTGRPKEGNPKPNTPL